MLNVFPELPNRGLAFLDTVIQISHILQLGVIGSSLRHSRTLTEILALAVFFHTTVITCINLLTSSCKAFRTCMSWDNWLRKERNISVSVIQFLLQGSASLLGIFRITQIAVSPCFGTLCLFLHLLSIGQSFSNLFTFGKSKLLCSTLCTVQVREFCSAHPSLCSSAEKEVAAEDAFLVLRQCFILRFLKV